MSFSLRRDEFATIAARTYGKQDPHSSPFNGAFAERAALI
jgi:hypothetical protein